jgi:hypothetical protein
MKFIKLACLLTSMGFSAVSYSQSCGKVIANNFVTQGDFAVTLEKHNGKRLNIPKLTRLPISPIESSGFAILKLTPGIHEFRGFAICASGYCKRSRILGGGGADEVNFAIEIAAGKSYKIAARPAQHRSLIPGKRFDVFVITEQEIECEGKAIKAITADEINPERSLVSI